MMLCWAFHYELPFFLLPSLFLSMFMSLIICLHEQCSSDYHVYVPSDYIWNTHLGYALIPGAPRLYIVLTTDNYLARYCQIILWNGYTGVCFTSRVQEFYLVLPSSHQHVLE